MARVAGHPFHRNSLAGQLTGVEVGTYALEGK